MAIRERHGKNGLSFQIIVYDRYTLAKDGSVIQKRKYKTFKPPKGMPLRKARNLAKEIEMEMQSQYERKENVGSEKKLNEVWNWYINFYAPNRLRENTIVLIKQVMENKVLPELGHLKIAMLQLTELLSS